jgi:hypothetical protein
LNNGRQGRLPLHGDSKNAGEAVDRIAVAKIAWLRE